MRAFWSGALSFGLVNIPIRVYPASEDHGLEFVLLHKKDLSPVRYARVCKLDGEEIPYKDIVKGFEYEKGEYVVVTPEDFARANAKKTQEINIQCFTSIDSIDPLYFEKPYYLEPDKKAGKAYNLLREALKKSKKVAIASFVFRNREHIGVIIPQGDALVLIQLRYQTEIRSANELNIATEKNAPKELDVALKLINQLTESFKPEKYKDIFSEELAAVIEARLQGKKPAKKAKPAARKASGDLMHLLKESLQKSIKKEAPKKQSIPSPSTTKRKPQRKKHA